MKITLMLVTVAILSLGCEQPQLNDVREDAAEVLDNARARAGELQELSSEELQELWAIEYTTLTLAHADTTDVDELLNDMGRERWDCYHVSEHEEGTTFYFKRNKTNLTTYLTNLLRLGTIAF